MVQVAGKYNFVSQEKFDEYLKDVGKSFVFCIEYTRKPEPFLHKNKGMGMITRKAAAATKPDVHITITGNQYKVEQMSSFKNITAEFTLGEKYEADPGTGKNTWITTVEGAKMITKVASTGKVAAVREFNDDGFVMTIYSDNVTATRTFKRA